MKNWILLFLLVLTCTHMSAQVGLGTTSPQASSILDITSTTKGLLIPRMTYAQKIAIPTPATGLMVYQTNVSGAEQAGLYYFDGSLWKRFARFDELGSGGNSSWTISGVDQYSNVTGNVGIGTITPTSKLHIDGSVLLEGSTFAFNHPSGILQFRNNSINKSYIQLSGDNLRLGTNAGNSAGQIIMRMDGVERMVIDNNGNIGMGTTSPDPSAKLHIQSTNSGLLIPRVTTSQMLSSISNPATGLMVYNTDQNQLYHHNGTSWRSILNSTYWLRGITNRDRIGNSADSVGIGTVGPQARLHVTNGSFANYTTHNGHIMVGSSSSENLAIGDYEILARNNGAAAPLYLQQEGGLVRIGNGGTATTAKLQITDGAEASLTTHGDLVIGEITSGNIVMDENEIQSRNNGSTDELYLQQAGGLVRIGDFDASPPSGARLQLTDGVDASLSQHGYLLLGEPESTNITIDNNEILARSNGTPSTLYLQDGGGTIDIGGHTTIRHGGSGEVLRIDGTTPNIGFYNNGTYKSYIAQGSSNLSVGVNGGKLQLDGTQIAIGSINSNASTYKLTVAGKVICEELKVELYNNWPDYVFHENYNLKPLHELKSFIETNHHLPNIPKAAEVEKEGIEVGEMNRKLLEKVEELTLYIIDLQEQINEIKSETRARAAE